MGTVTVKVVFTTVVALPQEAGANMWLVDSFVAEGAKTYSVLYRRYGTKRPLTDITDQVVAQIKEIVGRYTLVDDIIEIRARKESEENER